MELIDVKKIYTAIDIGSDSIKMVTAEMIGTKAHVLASSSVRSVGVKNGWITDPNMAANSIKLALKEMESMLGTKVEQAIVNVPTEDIEITIVMGQIEIEEEVTNDDVVKVLKDALLGQVEEHRELITIYPISFTLDDKENIKDPKGMLGSHLEVKAVIATVPRQSVRQVLSTMKLCNIEVVDMAFGVSGDYAEVRNKTIDSQVGAIVNIGFDKMEVSVLNKGIMIKNQILSLGSKSVDHDIRYIYKVDQMTARKLKETFAVATKRYADYNDVIEIESKNQEKLVINQSEISEIVEARLKEILNLAKKQINLLTKREISYIIITGGISELAGFQYLVEDVLERRATTLNMTTMGVRHNKYSSVLGMIKYFDQKLELRGQEYSMFQDSKIEEMKATKKKNMSSESTLSKVFGHFFEN